MGRCEKCGKPFDDHKLPALGLPIKPLCPPKDKK